MSVSVKEPWRKGVRTVWHVSVATICVLSLLPHIEVPGDFVDADKLWHLAAYFWLALLPFFSFADRRRAVWAALCMILLGAVLEGVQGFIPQRASSFADIVANSLGVVLGMATGGALRLRLAFAPSRSE